MGPDGEEAQIVAAIVALAHNLGLDVIAEGVETPGQLKRLVVLGCEYVQGYYFGRPIDAKATQNLLRRCPRHPDGSLVLAPARDSDSGGQLGFQRDPMVEEPAFRSG
jgi:predicted signal transduction protein with EAL and GGDEF domain